MLFHYKKRSPGNYASRVELLLNSKLETDLHKKQSIVLIFHIYWFKLVYFL